jgi:hypothetical protein
LLVVTEPTVHTAKCGHGDEDRDKESESTVEPLSKRLNKTSSYINQCFPGSPSDVSADFGIDSEPLFVKVYGAEESIPPGWESVLGSLKGLQIRARMCISFRRILILIPDFSKCGSG